jgi:hypothetical protein
VLKEHLKMTTRSLDNRGETEALAGAEASPLGPPSGRSAEIIPFPTLSPPPWAGEDEDADCWESVGILAVRLLGNFNLPKLLVMRQDQS